MFRLKDLAFEVYRRELDEFSAAQGEASAAAANKDMVMCASSPRRRSGRI